MPTGLTLSLKPRGGKLYYVESSCQVLDGNRHESRSGLEWELNGSLGGQCSSHSLKQALE